MRRLDLRVRTRYKDSRRFVRADYLESSAELANPGCGWYHVYTFAAEPPADGRPVSEETWLDEECKAERLALVLIDIGSYRKDVLPEEALSHIEEIFRFFRQEEKQMILRFAYDIKGEGLMREPSELALVKRHIEQLGSVVLRFVKEILVIQGVLVGNWGEMHGSRFLDEDSLITLVHTWYRVTEGRCFLAVRLPAQWRKIRGSQTLEGGLTERLALFNDGIFGSATDLGTYSAGSSDGPDAEGRRTLEEELLWQEKYMDSVPNGGEALIGSERIGYCQAAERMRRMHLTYLNSIYHQDRLRVWKGESIEDNSCWRGISGYDYIGRHLGYRFMVRDVRKKGGQLKITVENCGFACLCEEADCCLVTEKDGEEVDIRPILTDARKWKSQKKVNLSVLLPRPKDCGGNLRFFLRLTRRSDGRVLKFANQGAETQVLLGEYREYMEI